MKLTNITPSGKKSTVTVSDDVFAGKVNVELVSQAVRVYQSNQRQAPGVAKTRSQIARTKRKWYRQKGTGNARHGARSAHIFVGGGVAHGPKLNQHWNLSLSKRLKRQALVSALTSQVENTFVVDTLEDLAGKTQEAAQILKPVASEKERVLIVLPEMMDKPVRALRNLSNVLVVTASRLTVLEVVMADKIVLTKNAVTKLEERLTAKKETKPRAKAAKSETKKPEVKTKTTKTTSKKTTKAKK